MNNLTVPLAIVIGAALIAGAILITGGVYEFESVHMFSVNRYNKVTGSIYSCTYGDPCEPYETTQESMAPKADSQRSRFQFNDVHKGRDLFDDAQEGVNLLSEEADIPAGFEAVDPWRGVAIFAKACFGHPSPSKRQKLNATANAFGAPDVLRTCRFATPS